ncbi:MAG TPA: ATP-binding protein [Polyangiaceae bacterium]|nr:ATP-binding protein [Polyangiaceae bacterium]
MGPDDLRERVAELEAEVRVLHTMLQSAPDLITRTSIDGKFLYLNHVTPGFRMEDVVGSPAVSYLPEAHREIAYAAMKRSMETRSVQQFATVAPISADRMGHYLTRVSPIIEDGEVTSLVMVATDVTTLEEQRIYLQVAIDAGELGIWNYNPTDGELDWDARTYAIFGQAEGSPPPTAAEMLSAYVHPDDRELVTSALERTHVTGRYGPLQHRILRPRGEVRWVATSGLAVRGHDGNIASIVGCTQDITERRVLEERLIEAQKLESIGRLAGGVAHDFNNMLTAMFGNLEFAEEASSVAEVRPLLEAIRVTAERSAALTAQLLAFARRQVIEPKVIDPNDLIRRLDTVFQRAIGEHIRVVLSLAARGRIQTGESQLEQVVMNLVTNARDAMPRGGVLTLETKDVTLDQGYADTHPDVRPGPYVLLAVSDTGRGIAADAVPHVFEPFFTTRAGGTGLGLATCYGIVKQSGGHLSVYSELERGTTFKVYLPQVDAELPAESAREPGPQSSCGERILLVEDEAPVRSVIERTLLKHDYRVTSATTAEEALSLVDEEPAFDLLLSDVVLPGMGGRALADQLAQRIPGLRVLFISGYTENAIVSGGVLDAGLHFLQKPFLPSELLQAVRNVLHDVPDSRRQGWGDP